MTTRTNSKLARRSLSLSVIIGTLLIPLSALAAIWLTDPGEEGAAATSTTTTAAATPVTGETVFAAVGADEDDLEAACGRAGMKLVKLERKDKISDVQQAALDALRDICTQEGMPLPEAPVPDPIVETVVVTGSSQSSTSTSTSVAGSSHDDDDRYEDEEDEEDEDHEEEDHHEDEDDERGDD